VSGYHATQLGGLTIPEFPPVEPGRYFSLGDWFYGVQKYHADQMKLLPDDRMRWFTGMSMASFNSAYTAGAFTMKRLGPRGGKRYAIASVKAWADWYAQYRPRIEARAVGEAHRRLSGEYKPRRR